MGSPVHLGLVLEAVVANTRLLEGLMGRWDQMEARVMGRLEEWIRGRWGLQQDSARSDESSPQHGSFQSHCNESMLLANYVKVEVDEECELDQTMSETPTALDPLLVDSGTQQSLHCQTQMPADEENSNISLEESTAEHMDESCPLSRLSGSIVARVAIMGGVDMPGPGTTGTSEATTLEGSYAVERSRKRPAKENFPTTPSISGLEAKQVTTNKASEKRKCTVAGTRNSKEAFVAENESQGELFDGNVSAKPITEPPEKPFTSDSHDAHDYFCEVCGRVFKYGFHYEKHRMTHSGVKSFRCKLCNSEFANANTLKHHVLSHKGVRPFCCHICDKMFTQEAQLQKHMVTHTKLNHFVCDVCKKGFLQEALLKFHMRTHEQKATFQKEI